MARAALGGLATNCWVSSLVRPAVGGDPDIMATMTRIRTGWRLTEKSWSMIRQVRSLLLFPILSTIFILFAAVIIWGPAIALIGPPKHLVIGHKHLGYQLTHDLSQLSDQSPAYYVVFGVFGYIATALGVYFNGALAACASQVLEGKETNVSQGLAAANKRMGAILGWAALATTIGVILRQIESRFGWAGSIARILLGAGWVVASFFAIPALALEGAGPWSTLKRSVQIVKQKWGEGVTGYVAISAITGLAVLGIILPTVMLAVALSGTGSVFAVIVVAAIGVAALLAVSVVSSAMINVFRVAVYRYALSAAPQGVFSTDDLESAFPPRKKFWGKS